MNRIAALCLLMPALPLAGCDRSVEARPNRVERAHASTGLAVDSILPAGEALRRFQLQLPRVTALDAAAPHRDSLVTLFVRAVESGDTAALARLVVSKSEYAFLYFPSSVYARKPYELSPDIAWLLSEQNSRKGLTRLTRRLGGKSLAFRGYDCVDPHTEADNRIWRSCRLSYTDPATGNAIRGQLFGAIIERAGRYKFLSYANDF